MRIGCIIEARMTSTRLPGKVMKDVHGKPSIMRQIERIERSRFIDTIVVATTVNATDDPLAALLEEEGVEYFRGSEDDVLGRVAEAAAAFDLDVIVEITGDCPLVDIAESDRVVERFLEGGLAVASNCFIVTYPIGMDTIVFSRAALEESARKAVDPVHREHVCMYLFEHPYEYIFANMEAPPFLKGPQLRMTLDEQEDYEFICWVYDSLYPRKPDFTLYDVMKLLNRYPEKRLTIGELEIQKVR